MLKPISKSDDLQNQKTGHLKNTITSLISTFFLKPNGHDNEFPNEVYLPVTLTKTIFNRLEFQINNNKSNRARISCGKTRNRYSVWLYETGYTSETKRRN